jgi:uncharacterized protein YjiS (DUF1127 family)
MPGLPSFLRRKRDAASGGAPPRIRRRLPPPAQLRKDRRALLRLREERLRDLGGLMLEMYRRDHFRQDLLVDRCTELIAIEDRLGEVDALLTAAVSVRHRPAARCECGATILWGMRFCASCGREVAAPASAPETQGA